MPSDLVWQWAIIVVAAFMVVQAILWIVLLLVLIRLVGKLSRQIGPILESTKLTVGNVSAASTIISETAIQPFIRVAGFVAGVRRGAAVLAGLSRRRRVR